MDFVNFATVEFVGAIEAQRKYERDQRKWLRAWRKLERSQAKPSVVQPGRIAPAPEEPAQRAA